MTLRISRCCLGIGSATLVACSGVGSVEPQPTVRFVLDGPLCSSVVPVQFSIDALRVGTDTFFVHLAPEHTTSRSYVTSAGQHVIGARTLWGYVWPDKQVTLSPGEVFADSLPFYCS
jgi:hypothetical protein